MCGIAGIVDFSKRVSRQRVEKMLGTIVHRGPNSAGVYAKGPVGLGIRRLSIIDLKTGDQPIFNEDKSVVVVFNGEIYNFKSLRLNLEKKGHKFSTQTDTEVLVHLYEDKGPDLVKDLNGMFAFALWDSRQQKLVLARDHVGIKPLYYWRQSSRLVFGSELKAILACGVSRSLNAEAVTLYSYLGYVPQGISMYEEIYKLLPGQVATFSRQGWKVKTYYHLAQSDAEPDKSLDQLFAEVVERQSVADVPVGLLLSGGLDSSLIAYYFTQARHKVKSFSISFTEADYDEGKYAAQVARILGTEHYETNFSADKLLEIFPQVTTHLDEPLADPSLFPTWEVCRLTSTQVKAALSGDGGDELFGGYPTYQGHLVADKLPLPGLWRKLLLPLVQHWPNAWGRFGNYPLAETAQRFLAGLGLPATGRHLQWMSIVSGGQRPLLDIAGSQIYNRLVSQDLSPQQLDIQTYLADDLLVKTDRASMAHSLEVRVPFLDREVIAWALARENHVSLITTKRHLRRLLAEKLPVGVVQRPKKGFGIPLARWLRGPLRELAQDQLASPVLGDYFDCQVIDRLWREHLSGRADNSKMIWMLVIFSAWHQHWV